MESVSIELAASYLAVEWVTEQRWLARHAPAPKVSRAPLIATSGGLETRAQDVFLTISPADYVEALTGIEVPAHGSISCPFHDERSASCHIYADPSKGWYCFGCQRGGTIYDFASELYGLGTRGKDFVEMRDRLALELLRTAA